MALSSMGLPAGGVLAALELTTQRAIAIAIAVVALCAWLGYLVYENRRPGADGTEVIARQFFGSPNRKTPPDDDHFEGPRLDRFLLWALAALAICAIGLPWYWLMEPGRMEGSHRGFNKRSLHRGEALVGKDSFGCVNCHGPDGVGGSAPWNLAVLGEDGKPKQTAAGKDELVSVGWAAPALNTVALRYRFAQIKNVLIFGRGTQKPMPAWGIAGGGPMNDQQIDDLIHYMRELALKQDEDFEHAFEEELERNNDEDWDKAFDTVVANGMAKKKLQEASTKALEDAKKVAANADKTDGQILYEQHCARCHTKGWSYQTEDTPYAEPEEAGGGWYGPNLTGGSTVRQFPDEEDHIEFVTNGVEDNRAYGTGGVQKNSGGGMPYFANTLTEEQIKAVVEYERSL